MTVRVLLTGVSGTGKSTAVAALRARGFEAVDADEDGLSELVDAAEGELTGVGGGRDWVWNASRVAAVLDREVELLFLAGCSPNQGAFADRFDHVVLLHCPPDVIAERLRTRTTNPFGRRTDERERSLRLQAEVEPLLRARATLEVDTTAPLDRVVAAILAHVGVDGPASG